MKITKRSEKFENWFGSVEVIRHHPQEFGNAAEYELVINADQAAMITTEATIGAQCRIRITGDLEFSLLAQAMSAYSRRQATAEVETIDEE